MTTHLQNLQDLATTYDSIETAESKRSNPGLFDQKKRRLDGPAFPYTVSLGVQKWHSDFWRSMSLVGMPSFV
jgi:hypothetical protein